MYNYILFDLDGTLTDPKEGITNSVAYALRAYGIDENPDKLTPFIGPPLHESFMVYYGFDEGKAMEAVEVYREYFADKGIFENKLYPETKDFLRVLQKAGKKIALATSKPEIFARRILEHFEIDSYFDVIVGSNMDGSRTKKAEVIDEVFKRFEIEEGGAIEKSKAVMIGDRLHDIVGAQENSIDSIGVTFGYGGYEELKKAGATYIADSFEATKKWVL